MFNLQDKGMSLIGVVIIIIAVCLLGGGLYFYLQKQVSETPSDLQEQEQQQGEVIVGEKHEEEFTDEQEESNHTTCDNYDCLIVAASQCQPISATVSYSEIPTIILPFPEYSMSGQKKYEIKKPSNGNDCILNFSSVVNTMSISEEERKSLLAQGLTNDRINADLQTMNKNLKFAAQEQITCTSNTAIITAFLTDEKKLDALTKLSDLEKEIDLYDVEVKIGGSLFSASKDKTITYTLSSGQKLVCTVIIPLQSANTSVTISQKECTNQGGYIVQVNDDGTACPNSDIDLGAIVDGGKINNKYPQCCISK